METGGSKRSGDLEEPTGPGGSDPTRLPRKKPTQAGNQPTTSGALQQKRSCEQQRREWNTNSGEGVGGGSGEGEKRGGGQSGRGESGRAKEESEASRAR